ncbi:MULTISPECIES: J domain-containing protein [unclassified Paraburkholderia]|uniref:J domain-containing protein n=1 Tax=unclassified Paraburkholderia TaxID=2615204 RepID=UPI002AB1281E|nr:MULTISPECIES: J domain-containing protein [unclassified Paraburkholderia]
MSAPDPRTHEDYDRLYYRLDLEPGASAADIKHNYRQLAQIFHPDKWRHPTAASLHWADEQFKRIKEAREVLEAYWAAHHEAPSSGYALSDAQRGRALEQVRELQMRRERLSIDLDNLQRERLRTLAEIARMQNERERLIGDIVRLRDDASREREAHADWNEQKQAFSASNASSNSPSDYDAPHGYEAGIATPAESDFTPTKSHPIRHFFFSRFDDPSRGWLMTLSGAVFVLIVLFVAAHRIVFSVFDMTGSWRWLAVFLQTLLISTGAVLAGGFAWAQRTLHRADRAGRVHGVPLPVQETWLRVTTSLRGTSRHGAAWQIETGALSTGDSGFEIDAVLRYSTRPHGEGEANQAVRFRCRAQAAGAGATRIAWDFGVQAPTWWLVPAAQVVRDLRWRVEADIAGRI